jgi:hypothetical protein
LKIENIKKKLQRNAGDKNKVNGLPLMVPISIMMRSYVTSSIYSTCIRINSFKFLVEF